MKTPENSGLKRLRWSQVLFVRATRFGACLLLMLLWGCSSTLPTPEAAIDPNWLLSGEVLFAEPVAPEMLPDDDILGLEPEIRRYLAQIAPDESPQQRLVALVHAFENRDFTVQYQADRTLTASETYTRQQGNCMAFTVMMVAMARELGAEAHFNQVEVPPVWGHEEAQTFVVYRHINMVSETSRGRRVVDFNLAAYDPVYDQQKISDAEAFGQYYSNRGIEWMQQGDMRQAFLYLRKALALRPESADLWANLGAFYSRNQQPEAAEQSYLQALQLQEDHNIAISNIERLYRKQQRFALADQYAEKARFHRQRNPYYLYYQARNAYEHGDYKNAKRQLKRALWRHENDHRFHFLLGLTNFKLGEIEDSLEHFSAAFSLANNPGTQQAYNRKLEYLRNQQQ
ncbi:tetratricopeptide repeat protein [Microbulbifer harenosus]|uniref:Tetratricopeptide repeat protein n=1 Tax=Microbulbifer harenosus TaxID=2576840 RepID=A0ABY2UMR5_9GAMM|nr:tetratricopeptide repeat protein [Microbulbifer harenosus]